MKIAFSMLAAASAAISMALAAPQLGAPAPNFSGTTSNGATVSLSDFAGKTVVLEWTNHDCPFVKKHYGSGNMQALQKLATAEGTVWLTIISSAPEQQGHVDPATANSLTKDRGAAPTHVVMDETGQIGRLFSAKTTPHMFVIDPAGLVQYAGAIDSIPSANTADISRAENYVSAALSSLRNGAPVVTKQSQPYGCSVKYGT